MATINTYDLNYTDAFKLGIKNYANFNGRASRSEYWRFAAGITMIQGVLGIFAMICNALGLLSFESIVDKIGFGVSMFFELRRGDQGENAYGERTGYIPVTSDISKETGLEETPSRRQDWIMGITIFLIQSIQIADVVGELLWFGLNGNGYM